MRRLVVCVCVLLIGSCDSDDRPLVQSDAGSSQISALSDPPDDGPLPQRGSVPMLEISIPNCPSDQEPAHVPPIFTVEWETIDGAPEPGEVRSIIVPTAVYNDSWDDALDYIATNPDAPEWTAWQPYDPVNGTGTSWTSPPTDFGRHVFAVHGRPANGPPNPDFLFGRNAVKALVSSGTLGPVLTLSSDFMDDIITSAPNTPISFVDLQAGAPAEFRFTGDASPYCGVVTAYRYGWDITDFNDDDAWDTPWTDGDGSEITTDSRTFFFGTHTFVVEVIDNSGFRSGIPVTINYPNPQLVTADVVPGMCPNLANPQARDYVWAAVLGSASLDVNDITPASVVLTNAGFTANGASALEHRYQDIGGPSAGGTCACASETPDGNIDLLVKFNLHEVEKAMGPVQRDVDVELTLAGVKTDDTPIMAVDCLRLTGVRLPDDPPPPPPPGAGPDTEIFTVTNRYWIDGQEYGEIIDITDAVPDTVPENSWITVFYRGEPQLLQNPMCQDPINKCLSYQVQYERLRPEIPGTYAISGWLPIEPEDSNPFGTADSTSMNMGSMNYTVRARSVDETQMPDPTPPEVEIVANFAPTLLSHGIFNYDGTATSDGGTLEWDWINPANFNGQPGDTLDLSDPPNIWVVRQFYLTIKGTATDHPKEIDQGGVGSWLYLFSETADPMNRLRWGRAGVWVDGQVENALCDTFHVEVRYSLLDDPGGHVARQELDDVLGFFVDFEILGRDSKLTDEFEQFMFLHGNKALINAYNSSNVARWTETGELTFKIEMLYPD